MAGASHRCVIPGLNSTSSDFAELLMNDRKLNPSHYSVVLISEGAMFEGGEMIFADKTTDAFGHAKLGGIGDLVSAQLKDMTAKHNNGRSVDVVN